MRFLIQRVKHADVTIGHQSVGAISAGLMVLVGISDTDTAEIADKMVRKLIHLRIFEDELKKTNLALLDVKGSLLIVSQFTLYANCRKGNRPSFTLAGAPDHANQLYEYIIRLCKLEVPIVEHGEFGADMKVSLLNDGPFTILLDSDELN